MNKKTNIDEIIKLRNALIYKKTSDILNDVEKEKLEILENVIELNFDIEAAYNQLKLIKKFKNNKNKDIINAIEEIKKAQFYTFDNIFCYLSELNNWFKVFMS